MLFTLIYPRVVFCVSIYLVMNVGDLQHTVEKGLMDYEQQSSELDISNANAIQNKTIT